MRPFSIKRWIRDIDEMPFYYLLSLFILCSGIACGVFFPRFLSQAERSALSGMAQNTVRMAASSTPAIKMLLTTVWTNLRLALSIAAAGCLHLGHPIAVVALGIKGFSMGILFSAFSTGFSPMGVAAAVLYLLPHSIFYVPCYLSLGAHSMFHSTSLFRGRKTEPGRYLQQLFPLFGAIILGIMIEYILSPQILTLFVSIL